MPTAKPSKIFYISGFFVVILSLAYFRLYQSDTRITENHIEQDIALSTPVIEQPILHSVDKLNTMQEQADASIEKLTYDNAVDFHEAFYKAAQSWHRTRGYHLSEEFVGYEGPETYTGPHIYGYLKEEELKVLAESGDPDAQVIYAHYYVSKTDRKHAFDLFKEVAINTEQTGPLGTMGVYLLLEAEEAKGGNAIPEDSIEMKENNAIAYFALMEQRNDPQGTEYLEIAGYDNFSNERKEMIAQLATELNNQFSELRQQRGHPPYESEKFEPSKSMGLSDEEYNRLADVYDYDSLDEDTAIEIELRLFSHLTMDDFNE